MADNKKKRVGIIGTGVTGLFAAYYLVQRGYSVTLFDPAKQVGGLASCIDFAGTKIERFFHHIFSTDKELIAFIHAMGLQDEILWEKSKVGFYCGGKPYPFDSPLDILRFKPLSLKDRCLLGISILYFKYQKNYKHLEDVSIEDWYKRISGVRIFNIVWKPLLISKFGVEYYQKIPASWLWGRIHPRVNSRGKGGELLGYLRGSTQVLLDKIVDRIGKDNFINEKVISVKEHGKKVVITTPQQSYEFDQIIATTPLPLFLSFYQTRFTEEAKKIGAINYQGAICAILEIEKPLSEYYWLNITDKDISFAGIIEQTNFLPTSFYGGKSIVYLFNYLPPADPFFQSSEEDIIRRYTDDLEKMFVNFKRSLIKQYVVNRTRYATPIYERNYSQKIPPYRLTDRIFLCNTAQIYPIDRNINNSILAVHRLLEEFE